MIRYYGGGGNCPGGYLLGHPLDLPLSITFVISELNESFFLPVLFAKMSSSRNQGIFEVVAMRMLMPLIPLVQCSGKNVFYFNKKKDSKICMQLLQILWIRPCSSSCVRYFCNINILQYVLLEKPKNL